MADPFIYKALSGFYYVRDGERDIECRARGRFRKEGITPLVGDFVRYSVDFSGKGTIEEVLERKNSFQRPAVANIGCMVVLVSAVNPISDPFLIDCVTARAENVGCEVIICINKSDLDPGDYYYDIYKTTGYTVIRTSAKNGDGIDELRGAIAGKVCAFTGNTGVGKSSILNALSSDLHIKVGEVSDKLGRGRHTTRHVELFPLGDGAYIADTPGFSSFDIEKTALNPKGNIQYCFIEFSPYLGSCRFDDCAHIAEPNCAVLQAVAEGKISASRHSSYVKLYEIAAQVKDWELNKDKH